MRRNIILAIMFAAIFGVLVFQHNKIVSLESDLADLYKSHMNLLESYSHLLKHVAPSEQSNFIMI